MNQSTVGSNKMEIFFSQWLKGASTLSIFLFLSSYLAEGEKKKSRRGKKWWPLFCGCPREKYGPTENPLKTRNGLQKTYKQKPDCQSYSSSSPLKGSFIFFQVKQFLFEHVISDPSSIEMSKAERKTFWESSKKGSLS